MLHPAAWDKGDKSCCLGTALRVQVRGSDCSAALGNGVELLRLPRRWMKALLSQFIVSLMSDIIAKSVLAKLLC